MPFMDIFTDMRNFAATIVITDVADLILMVRRKSADRNKCGYRMRSMACVVGMVVMMAKRDGILDRQSGQSNNYQPSVLPEPAQAVLPSEPRSRTGCYIIQQVELDAMASFVERCCKHVTQRQPPGIWPYILAVLWSADGVEAECVVRAHGVPYGSRTRVSSVRG